MSRAQAQVVWAGDQWALCPRPSAGILQTSDAAVWVLGGVDGWLGVGHLANSTTRYYHLIESGGRFDRVVGGVGG